MHLPENTSLQSGRYLIKRFISSGGFGCTYEAEHTLLEKRVAIKEFFVKDFCNRDEATAHVTVGTVGKKALVEKLKKKFLDEAKSLCKLQHPGIVSVSDVFEENGTAYYVMDYIDGLSLGDLLKKQGPLSESVAVGYIRQVCDALKYVHGCHRLHLDIKPGNIMTDSTGKAILIDFGASKQYDEIDGENTSTLMGHTPGYAPLEQMGNDVAKFHPCTDIYALGATLYKLLTGETPLNATRRASGEKLAPLPSELSSSTCAAVLSAINLVKNERPQTIDAFLEILDGKVLVDEDEKTIIDDENDDVTIPDDPKPTPNPNPNPDDKEKNEKVVEKSDAPVSVSSMVKKMVIFTGIFVAYTLSFYWIPSSMSPILSIFYGVIFTIASYFIYRVGISTKNLLSEIRSLGNKKNEKNSNKITLKKFAVFLGLFSFIYVVLLIISNNSLLDNTIYSIIFTVIIYILYRSYKILRNIIIAIRNSKKGAKDIKITLSAVIATVMAIILFFYFSLKQYVDYNAVAQPVDLGLSVKWASWNVGASSPEECGGQYAWGETEIKLLYRISNYKHSSSLMMDIFGSAYDVAYREWGNGWRMPTEAEVDELINKCTWTWTTYNGVNGYNVKGRNGNSIFLPVTGYRELDFISDKDEGLYWTGTYVKDWQAAFLNFERSDIRNSSNCVREFGYSIRPVKE